MTAGPAGRATLWTQEMRALLRRWYLQFSRERANVVLTLVQPVVWLVFFGGAVGRVVDRGSFGDADYVGFILPGVVAFSVIGTSISGALPLLWDKETGYLGKLLSMPIARSSVLLSRLVFLAAVTTAQTSVILLVAAALGVRAGSAAGWLLAVGIGDLLAIALTSVFLALALHGPGHTTFFAVSGFITLPLLLTSSAFVPITAMPPWMEWVTRFNPLTYAIESTRALVLGGPAGLPIRYMALLCGFTIVCVITACWAFRQHLRSAADRR